MEEFDEFRPPPPGRWHVPAQPVPEDDWSDEHDVAPVVRRRQQREVEAEDEFENVEFVEADDSAQYEAYDYDSAQYEAYDDFEVDEPEFEVDDDIDPWPVDDVVSSRPEPRAMPEPVLAVPVPPLAPPVEDIPAPKLTPKEDRTQRRLTKFARMDRRFALIIDVDGPKVRLGILWFLALVFASAVGRYSVGALFSVVTVVAALQIAAHLMIEEDRRSRLVAGGIAGLLTLSAIWGAQVVGGAVLVSVLVAAGVSQTTLDPEWRVPLMAMTVRAGLFVGLAGASAVLAHRVDAWAYFYLIFALSAYEAGSFLVGSGARNQIQGPLAGAALIAAVTFGASAFEFAPLTEKNTLVFGAMFAVLCPLGQLLGTALLPRADCKAPALRRIDSFLMAGPAYVVGLWIASGTLKW